VLTDHVSTLLFCPTDAAVRNLKQEGITRGVHRVGDVMYDALLHNLEMARGRSGILTRLDLKKGGYALATVHRAANTDDRQRIGAILDGLGRLPDPVIFPTHPRVHKMMQEWGLSVRSNVRLLEPLGYFDMLILQENAACILTDSGGVQKEAYLLGVRCITLREETEWVETVTAGWNRLVGAKAEMIEAAYNSWYPQGERASLYGDGRAAKQICGILIAELMA
jgi:UDP-N-acetylglucosamine 2-epimerase